MAMMVTKLYCYVDESGQETLGRVFVVSVVVIVENRDKVFTLCEQLEQVSGKGKHKWGDADHKNRMRYLRYIFADDRFKGLLRYEVFRKTTDYDTATITAIDDAVKWKKPREKYTTLIYVDGLTKTKRQEYGARLRHLGLPVRKIKGVRRDESNTLTRLADSLCGFIHDALDEESKEIKTLFQKAKRDGMLVDVSA